MNVIKFGANQYLIPAGFAHKLIFSLEKIFLNIWSGTTAQEHQRRAESHTLPVYGI